MIQVLVHNVQIIILIICKTKHVIVVQILVQIVKTVQVIINVLFVWTHIIYTNHCVIKIVQHLLRIVYSN